MVDIDLNADDADLTRDIRLLPTSELIGILSNPSGLASTYKEDLQELSDRYPVPLGIPPKEHQDLKDRYARWIAKVIPLLEAEIDRRIPIPTD